MPERQRLPRHRPCKRSSSPRIQELELLHFPWWSSFFFLPCGAGAPPAAFDFDLTALDFDLTAFDFDLNAFD